MHWRHRKINYGVHRIRTETMIFSFLSFLLVWMYPDSHSPKTSKIWAHPNRNDDLLFPVVLLVAQLWTFEIWYDKIAFNRAWCWDWITPDSNSLTSDPAWHCYLTVVFLIYLVMYYFQSPPKTSKNQLGGVRIIQLPGALRPQSGARPIKSVIIKKYSFATSTISVFCVSQTTIFPHCHAFLTRPRFLCCRICVGCLRSNYPRWRYRNQHQRVLQTARWLWGLGTVSVSYVS